MSGERHTTDVFGDITVVSKFTGSRHSKINTISFSGVADVSTIH